jgi:hypothetical protein
MAKKPILPRITAGISGQGGSKVQNPYKELGISPSVTMSDIRGALQPAKPTSMADYEKRLRKNPKK